MASVRWQFYGSAGPKVMNKLADCGPDIAITAHNSASTRNLDTHDYGGDPTNGVATGDWRTLGVKTPASKTISYAAAYNFTAAAFSTAYLVGQVRPPSSAATYPYRVVAADASSGSAPIWPTTLGGTATDSTVTWQDVGRGGTNLYATDLQRAELMKLPCHRLVMYDRYAGRPANQPLIGSNHVGGGGTSEVTFDCDGVLFISSLPA